MKVVLDAGPIIALAKVGALRVLPALFDDVLVPSVVMHEVAPRGEKRPGAEIREQPWVRVVRVRLARVASLEHAFDIDPGEAAAIAVAEDDPAASVILMDDRAGLAAARSRGVAVLRTGALLVYASEEKLLSAIEVAAALVKLREERYLSATAEQKSYVVSPVDDASAHATAPAAGGIRTSLAMFSSSGQAPSVYRAGRGTDAFRAARDRGASP